MTHRDAFSPVATAADEPQAAKGLREDARRQDEILGAGPRIAPLANAEIGADGIAIVRSLRAAAGLADTGEVPQIVATLLRHPRLYEKHAAVGAALLGGGVLSPRQRELAILRTGWLCGAPFEWGEHVAMAKRAGLGTAEIERLTQDAETAGWNDADGAIVSAAEELHRGAMISDAVWARLGAVLDEGQLIELVYVVGHYTKVAYLQNALRLRLPAGNDGLAARSALLPLRRARL
jgi:alkylhydroperoxidase family enzyme